MVYSEDQITAFSKSDNNVMIDLNFRTDHTFTFLDTIFNTNISRIGNIFNK